MGSICGVLTLNPEKQCTLCVQNGIVYVLQMLPLGTPRRLQIQINDAIKLEDDDVPLLAMFSSEEEL